MVEHGARPMGRKMLAAQVSIILVAITMLYRIAAAPFCCFLLQLYSGTSTSSNAILRRSTAAVS